MAEDERGMREKDILKAVKDHVNSQNNSWTFVMGRKVLDKKEFIALLEKDKKFRKLITTMVIDLSIDILTRKGGKKSETDYNTPSIR